MTLRVGSQMENARIVKFSLHESEPCVADYIADLVDEFQVETILKHRAISFDSDGNIFILVL